VNGLTVPVAIVGSRTEAELIVGFLQNQGVRAAVAADDAGGQEPELQLQGVRVLVASSDEIEARRYLATVGAGDGDGDATSITGDTVTGARPARETLRVHTEYDDAQRDVDALSDARFPVERVSIVGRDLRLDEDVTGRLTVPRAAGAGAGGGAWFGLLIGVVFFLFTPYWLLPVLTGVVLGAIFGAIFGAVAQAATRGRRDFASVRHLEAGSYEVVVDSELADGARRLLHLDPAPGPRDASPAPPAPPRAR
jgi:hypothetical protein